MKNTILGIGIVVALLVFTSGCVEDEAEVGAAVTEIRIGDTPIEDFSYVNVTFSEFKLHSTEVGWTNTTVDKTIDLINLHLLDLTEQLGIVDLDIGNYTKLWLVVDNATGVLKEGNQEINFTIPSNTLKIQQLFKLTEGENTITVDIDLNTSIREYGSSEEYKLLPVIGMLEHRHENTVQFKETNPGKLKQMTENRAPVIDVVANGSRGKPVTAVVDQNITFNASETFDVDGDSITYAWDFDDGTNATDPVVNHSYDKPGSYWVTLTVSDTEFDATVEIHVTVKKQGS